MAVTKCRECGEKSRAKICPECLAIRDVMEFAKRMGSINRDLDRLEEKIQALEKRPMAISISGHTVQGPGPASQGYRDLSVRVTDKNRADGAENAILGKSLLNRLHLVDP